MMDLASQSEKKRDWPAALQNYASARDLDPNVSAVAGAAIARIQAQMSQEGADAFKRARQYDALNRVDDAIAWYERAARNLPDSSPDKGIASDRLRALKQAR
jgi:tetratricopeptide (TPR) repeat protein